MLALALACVAFTQEEWELNPDGVDPACARSAQSLHSTLEDISLLNLLNGLHLSHDQMERVRDLSREAASLRARAFEEHRREIDEFHRTVSDLKGILQSGHPHPPRELEEAAQRYEGRVNEIRHQYLRELRVLEDQLRGVLSSGQVEVAREFNPCLIPPRELRDPVRVGQPENDTAEIEEGIEMLRFVPERAFAAVRDAYIELMTLMQERTLGAMTEDERVAERARLAAVADKARALSDEEYAVQRGAIAQEVTQRFTQFVERAGELQEFFTQAQGGMTKVGKYLLNPRIVPLIEAKLAAPAVPAGHAPEDGPVAESCSRCGGVERAGAPVDTVAKKPRFEEFAAYLGIEGEPARSVRGSIARGQVALLELLARPRGDGRNILREFLMAAFTGGEEQAFLLFGEESPTGRSYIVEIGEIKERMNGEIADVLTGAQWRRLEASGVDLFDVKVGDLRPFAQE